MVFDLGRWAQIVLNVNAQGQWSVRLQEADRQRNLISADTVAAQQLVGQFMDAMAALAAQEATIEAGYAMDVVAAKKPAVVKPQK